MNKNLEYFNGDELAANVWDSKYKQPGEETADDMHRRMANEFGKIQKKPTQCFLKKHKLSEYGKVRKNLDSNEIYELFKDFKYVIPQGSVMSGLGSDKIVSLSNCFVIGESEDSYGGIFGKDEEMAQLMKRRGGVGIDISTLRPEGADVNNAAKTSTGAISFMHRFSNTTREVAQGGRRGALMISMDVNHPDIMEFIKIKRDLSNVTGANISIKLNNEFMNAVEEGADYMLKFPVNADVLHIPINDWEALEYDTLTNIGDVKIKKINAREYWTEIIESAHASAEPGLMYWDTMVNYSPDGVYPQYRQVSTNPCSEIAMQPYDACRLIAVNLFGFVEKPYTDKAKFNFKKFYEINYEAMHLSDGLVDLELLYIGRILDKIKKDPELDVNKKRELDLWNNIYNTAKASRRTGLGFTALGDTVAALGMKYDSAESIKFVEKMMKIKMKSELDNTIDNAVLRGTFTGWDPKKERDNIFYDFIKKSFPEQYKRMQKYGRRNVSWSTLAPTGSVSLLAQVTSGVEPLFQPFYMRRKKVNPGEKDVRVDFTDKNGDTWQEFPVIHAKFEEWIHSNYNVRGTLNEERLQKYFEKSPWFGSTANDIDWNKRVEIQSMIQRYISHSISSTVNLPRDVSKEAVSDIYLQSWRKGLKGITVYRDGSRDGVLVSSTPPSEDNIFEYTSSVKRPTSIPAESFATTVRGEKFNVVIGLLDDKPYEVFAFNQMTVMKGEGTLTKERRGIYTYHNDKTGKETLNIADGMTDEHAAITRLISTSLRHGADIKFIVEQLNKSKGDLFSFTKAIARVLKKYIPDGANSTVSCMECGSTNVIFQEGCSSCLDCGSSKCG